MIEEIPLSPFERNQNRREFRKAAIVVCVILVALTPLYFFMFKMNILIVRIFIGFVLLYLMYIFYNMLIGAYLDYSKNTKFHIKGTITNKYTKTKSSGLSSSGGGSYAGGKLYSSGSSSNSSPSILYFIEIDGEPVKVPESYYYQIKNGMFVDVYASRGSRVMIS